MTGLHLQAHHSGWTTCLIAGEPAGPAITARRAAGSTIPRGTGRTGYFTAGTIPACARATGAQADWLLGYPDKALAIGSEALDLAEQIAHPLSLEMALIYNTLLHFDRASPN